jgi:hypothetical protein
MLLKDAAFRTLAALISHSTYPSLSSFSRVLTIMFHRGLWLQVGTSVLFTVAAALCVTFCFEMMCEQTNLKDGIITLIVRHYLCLKLQFSNF